jgi:hypothetical protein
VSPSEEYRKRLDARVQTIAASERQHILLGYLKLVVIAAFIVLLWLRFARHLFSGYWLLAPVGAYLVLAVLHERVIGARTHAETAANLYRRGLARIEDRWSGTGASGDRFRESQHVYAEDLDVFGSGSLFELLSTARMPMGENRLAEWLRSASPVNTVIERQGLIAELEPKLELREDLAVTGEDLRARLNPESLTKWCESTPVLGGPIIRLIRLIAATFAVVSSSCFVYFIHTRIIWPFLAILIVEAILFRGLRQRALKVMSGVNCNSEGVVLFSQILERLERESFAAPHLQQLVAELKRGAEPASRSVRRFARIVNWIDAYGGLIVRIIEVPLLYSVQTGFAAEAWRKRCGSLMRTWIDIAGEAEALLSLATYSFEHPVDTFPEFADSPAVFAAEGLGHPLIEISRCVRNDVRLDAKTRMLLVSGSNMSGKSTLLRTVGINTILAMAGAPIRGKRLQLSPLALGVASGASTRYRRGVRLSMRNCSGFARYSK